jgi:hypothetical protein
MGGIPEQTSWHFTPTGGETILHASGRPDRGPAGNVPDKLPMDARQRLLYRKNFLIKPSQRGLAGKVSDYRHLRGKKFRLNGC